MIRRIITAFDLSFLCCLQGLGQLIGARGGATAAADAFDAGDDVFNALAFTQCADALQISVATADKTKVADLAVNDLKNNFAGASAAGFVMMLHNTFPFFYV